MVSITGICSRLSVRCFLITVFSAWLFLTNGLCLEYVVIFKRTKIEFASFTLPETNELPLKIDSWKRIFLLETVIFRGHVSFRECTNSVPCFSLIQGGSIGRMTSVQTNGTIKQSWNCFLFHQRTLGRSADIYPTNQLYVGIWWGPHFVKHAFVWQKYMFLLHHMYLEIYIYVYMLIWMVL